MTGKLRWATEARAKAMLVGSIIAQNRGSATRHEQRIYQCEKCQGFHLTSVDAKRFAQLQRKGSVR